MTTAGTMLVAALALSTGCGLLDTDQPNIVEPGDVETEAGAQARRVGAISDFAFAQDGDGTQFEDGHIHPDADPGIGEMFSLAGFTYLFLGESFCSGVPFSRLEGEEVVFGDPQNTDEMFQAAVSRFDAALAEPGTVAEESQEIAYLASVGKGRGLLDRGLFAEAAAAVAAVPTEFQYLTEHAESPLRLQNAIYSYSVGFLWSVSDLEGGAGLPYRTAEDPRVPTFFDPDNPVGLDFTTEQHTLLKHLDASASVVVADGIEARLIEAEAALQASDLAGMTAFLNDLRDTQGLDPLAVPGSQAEGVDLLFSERAFWMFATGHRLGDMRRLIRQYGRSAESGLPQRYLPQRRQLRRRRQPADPAGGREQSERGRVS
jgi:hypothetical protein